MLATSIGIGAALGGRLYARCRGPWHQRRTHRLQPPVQANADVAAAEIVLPTTYRFQQRGARMAGRGNMTIVMRRDGERWKIASWTYAGSTPAA